MPRLTFPTSMRAKSAAAARRAASGFTLIEMLIVMTLIALLLTLAVPSYFRSLDGARLRVEQQNLTTIRDAIDKYYGDLGHYPDTLDDLVTKRYLRQIPVNPVSEVADWVIVPPADTTMGAVFDVQPKPKADAVATAEH